MPLQSVLGGLGLRGACGRLLGLRSGRRARLGCRSRTSHCLGLGLSLDFGFQLGLFLLACKSKSGD